MSTVIQSMQKFCWKKHILPLEKCIDTIAPGNVMFGVHPVAVQPGMNNRTLLYIMSGIIRHQIEVKTTFIAIRPKYNGWMVDIFQNKFFHQLSAGFGIVRRILPASELVNDK